MDNLGTQLRRARTRVGMSLRELARQADVSPSLVSLIENGKSQPSVATLYSLSRILDVSVEELFEQERTSHAVLASTAAVLDPVHAWQPTSLGERVSFDEAVRRPRLSMAEGVTWERLAATPEPNVGFMKVTYLPGAASTAGGELLTHEGFEYGYVVRGEVEVTVGERVHRLREDESLAFDSSIPHVLRNTGSEAFEGIWFVHGPPH